MQPEKLYMATDDGHIQEFDVLKRVGSEYLANLSGQSTSVVERVQVGEVDNAKTFFTTQSLAASSKIVAIDSAMSDMGSARARLVQYTGL